MTSAINVSKPDMNYVESVGICEYQYFNMTPCVPVSGSLGTSIFDMQSVLVGASGGVYALLAGHMATLVMVDLFLY